MEEAMLARAMQLVYGGEHDDMTCGQIRQILVAEFGADAIGDFLEPTGGNDDGRD